MSSSAAPESPATKDGRLLLVSNRLPVTIKRTEEGKYDTSMSSGGLVSGLSGLSKSTTFQWYGWPGLEVPDNEITALKQRLKDEYDAIPIMLDDELADRHYNGFSSMFLVPSPAMSPLTFTHTPAQTQSSGPFSITTPAK